MIYVAMQISLQAVAVKATQTQFIASWYSFTTPREGHMASGGRGTIVREQSFNYTRWLPLSGAGPMSPFDRRGAASRSAKLCTDQPICRKPQYIVAMAAASPCHVPPRLALTRFSVISHCLVRTAEWVTGLRFTASREFRSRLMTRRDSLQPMLHHRDIAARGAARNHRLCALRRLSSCVVTARVSATLTLGTRNYLNLGVSASIHNECLDLFLRV